MSTSSTAPHATRSTWAAFLSARTWGRGALAVVVASAAFQALPAAAALESPVITGPAGTVGTSPQLSWDAVVGATAYEVQVDDNSTFSSPEWKPTATLNTVSVPTEPLATGTQHMRVRAREGRSTWGEWSESSFVVGSIAGPELVSPAPGAELTPPDEAPLLSWTPITGAKSYSVEIDTEDQFIDPASYSTTSTSMVVPDNQVPTQKYYWRVRATLATGVFTDYSDRFTDRTLDGSGSYTLFALTAPDIESPRHQERVTDVVLDWKPVRGAKHYNLQVDDDRNFSSPLTGIPAKIVGTRYSPKTTFGNGQYYWRVRAVDADDNPSPWVTLADGEHHEFERVWRDIPQLVHPYLPADREATLPVEKDLYFEWTPVRNASHYELWLSQDANFTSTNATTVQCLIVGTTYTPGEFDPKPDKCLPKSDGGVYYWRVRAFDKPFASGGVPGIFSETQKFIYRDQSPLRILTPRSEANVEVPSVTWEPVADTNRYRVEFLGVDGAVEDRAFTYSTSYTPAELDRRKGPFTVRVHAIDAASAPTLKAERTFSLVEPAEPDEASDAPELTPVAKAPTFDAPALSWQPKPNAHHYRVHMRNTASDTWFPVDHAPVLEERWLFPAVTDTSVRFLTSGTYEWYVTAHAGNGDQLGDRGASSTVEVLSLPAVSGHRIAVTGSGLDNGDACDKSLYAGPKNWCDNVPTTPVLDWTGVPYASYYRVHVSRDADFTNGSLDVPVSTVNTRWSPRASYKQAAFPDSQANTAYYWYIQPCKSSTECGPDPRSTINPSRHAFRKVSPQVELTAPAPGAVERDTEVTFTWQDYLDTNRATIFAETGEPSTQSAMSYEIQVSTEPTFTTLLESAVVDQTTFTSDARTYPEGPLHWRVQAVDGHDNKLGWSTRTFTKATAAPELLDPKGAELVGRNVAFQWKPQAFAASYEIQVAANEDTNFSSSNLKVTKTSKRAVWTTGGSGVATLLPSEAPYVWRVRRVDSGGNRGPWTDPERFVVRSEHPTQLTPAADATVGPHAMLLTWESVEGTSRHVVRYRKVGTTSTTTATTIATSFAPVNLTIDTDYEWQVESLDAGAKVIGASRWTKFTIGGPPSPDVETDLAGSGILGTELVVTGPTWNREGVVNTYEWLRDGEPIADTTGERYRVTVDDVGKKISVKATGVSSEFGVGTSTSNEVEGQPGAGPEATATPRISGTGAVGTTLTSTDATWLDDDVTVARQWLRDGNVIPGATAETYAVTAADLDKSLTLRVAGTRAGRLPTLVTSNAVRGVLGAAPRATTTPVIEGTAKVGNTLSVTAPQWSESGTSLSYQWLADGREIANAIQATYAVADDDLERRLSVRVTAQIPGHAPGTVTSATVKVSAGDAPTAQIPPTVSGTAKVGGTLTAAVPWWSLTGVTTSSQWLRDGRPIAGASEQTYEPVAADVGRAISVRFTALRPGYAPGTIDSEPVTVELGDATWSQNPPSVRGVPKVGSTLTATPPTWATEGVRSAGQWLRDGRPIPGATSSTYRLVAADLGSRISVRYVGALPGHEDADVASQSLTVTRGDAPAATGVQAPGGTPKVGATLRAPQVAWSLAGVTQTRQWLRNGQPISGATGETYVVVTADAGRSLAVVTTATLPGHAPGAITSPAVKVAAVAVAPPVVKKVNSKTTLKVAKRVSAKGKSKARVKVTVKVSAKGAAPTGTVKIYAGKKLVGKVKLKNGKVTLRLKSLRVGTHKLTVKYAGSKRVKTSRSKKRTVRIVRR